MSVVLEDEQGGLHYLGAWTIPQVCERLSISRATCYRMIGAGNLKTITVGKRGTRITVASVMKCFSHPTK